MRKHGLVKYELVRILISQVASMCWDKESEDGDDVAGICGQGR